MSRTYYNRSQTFEQYHSNWIFHEDGTATYGRDCRYGWTKEEVTSVRVKYKYRSERGYDMTLPRQFRNSINRKRRAKDRQELWKELNCLGYEGLYSKWNCKDNHHWDFW